MVRLARMLLPPPLSASQAATGVDITNRAGITGIFS